MRFNSILTVLISFFVFFPINSSAENIPLNEFKSGSYQNILKKQTDKPFILVIWSINCPSCIKDMENLKALHKKNPGLEVIMLSADELSDAESIRDMIEQHHLSDVENWVYADENTQKLRFEIDPNWYGEMPRTYFFDKQHRRSSFSGVLSEQDFAEQVEGILR